MRFPHVARACVVWSLLLLAGTAGWAAEIDPLDWPDWRGPEQNRISRETGLISEWDPESGENVLWKNEELATISTPIVMNGKLYVLCRSEPGTKREGEKVVCTDPATGEILWENKFNVFLSDVPDTRVAWSSVTGDPATGRVYAQGVCGLFLCLDGETGKTIWERSLAEEFGMINTYGGRTNVPIVYKNLVIISGICTNWGPVPKRPMPGETPAEPTPAAKYLAFSPTTGGKGDMPKPAHRFIGFEKSTGDVLWFNGLELLPDDTTYSTPTLAVIEGQPLLVFGAGDGGIWGMQPRTGKIVWRYNISRRGVNVSPLVVGSKVYASQSEENIDFAMGCVSAIDATKEGDITKTGELWRVREIMAGKVSPLLADDKLFISEDSGGTHVLNPETGERIGSRIRLVGTILRATPLYADGKVYICTTSAWHVLEPNEEGAKVVNRMRLPEGEEVYGSPIVSHGRIYLPTTGGMYCLGEKGKEPAAESQPPQPKETPVKEDMTPAHAQLVPAEVLLRPGQKQQFAVWLFNSNGQFLKQSPAEFNVDANGTITSEGVLAVDAKAGHTSANVEAKAGDLAAYARVRIVPPLPWKFDFSDNQVPITWVGARYRNQVRDMDGEKVLVKVTTIPKGTRSQSWMGHTELHDYTIQADVRVAIADGKLPDIGLIAQRYTLDMMGANQTLQIRSWTAQLEGRFAVTIPFKFEPDIWYTMKFQASAPDGKAVLKGKVWKRGEEEPQEWTVEGTDELPNEVGSPGLYGNAKDAEIYYDNITVTSNEAKPTTAAE